MTSNLKTRASFALLPLFSLTLSAITFAAEPTTSSSPSPVTVHFEKKFEPNREREKPRSPLALGKKLDAYTLTLKNTGPNPVQILSGQIINHLTPEFAYTQAKQSAGLQYAEAAVLGLACAPFTFGLSLPVELFIAGPIAASHAGNKNKEALGYINQHPGLIPLETILPQESKQYSLITLKDVKPEAKLTVQDLKTQQEWILP